MNIIGFAIVRFVLSIFSCSSDFVLKLGLRERDTKTMCACGVQNGIKFQRWRLPIFFPNSLRHSDFSGKDDTEEEFLGFEGPSSSEAEGKIEVLEENRCGINLRLTGSRVPMVNRFFFVAAWRSRGQKCFFIRISFPYQKSFEVTVLSLLKLDTGTQVYKRCLTIFC